MHLLSLALLALWTATAGLAVPLPGTSGIPADLGKLLNPAPIKTLWDCVWSYQHGHIGGATGGDERGSGFAPKRRIDLKEALKWCRSKGYDPKSKSAESHFDCAWKVQHGLLTGAEADCKRLANGRKFAPMHKVLDWTRESAYKNGRKLAAVEQPDQNNAGDDTNGAKKNQPSAFSTSYFSRLGSIIQSAATDLSQKFEHAQIRTGAIPNSNLLRALAS